MLHQYLRTVLGYNYYYSHCLCYLIKQKVKKIYQKPYHITCDFSGLFILLQGGELLNII